MGVVLPSEPCKQYLTKSDGEVTPREMSDTSSKVVPCYFVKLRPLNL